MSSANALDLDQSKNLLFGKELTVYNKFTIWHFNSLPKNKILDVTKLKAFADEKLNVAIKTISLFDRVENTVEKGGNAGYQHFLFFPQCFPKPSSLRSLKVGIVR